MSSVASVVTLAVVGAGDRGTGHARWALDSPERAKVVAVAEPRETRRRRFAAAHALEPDAAVDDWRVLAARGRIADAVLICTLDREHLEPVLEFAALGYHILLEKPMALTEDECRRIVDAVEKAGVILAVGHVLRYTRYTRAVKEVVDSGRLGDVVNVQHLEPVGFWHQAHSFVRGNWGRTDRATSMLMAKSCHDLDWLQYILGQPPVRVSSFGRLSHFRPENRPEGAADRCLDCAVENACPYSARREYGDRLARGEHHWPLSVLVDDFTPEALETALREGPYGRCVYACDNDVVDHQVVSMEFASGATATFTMTAFTEQADRRTRIFGTRGELRGDGGSVSVYDFLTRTEEAVDLADMGGMDAAGGHGGGDAGLMDSFVAAVATGNPDLVKSGPRESLTSHLTVLAAERARHAGTVEDV
ncbi:MULTISPECIES: Gfo/Idh/MocA family protein [unclassified Streptomyces]|uniref:Gfo/Idh/MocA family protein n=1 Tax=unclassified Streptomyces TaxID=2593676 RepID=UPI00224CE321|nr:MULTISPECIES: Gfo/Idh/MocA family oxidoreductase [unclassified Streptomyces]MCX4990776.1 Gfo/Idh/MocA family oxidoreductase [Streptomyces sp. NBC_00568]MCX5003993.1 Gfo/Idh/MocA family oxidoreductase [Streptomyces sp. NBC_00638]